MESKSIKISMYKIERLYHEDSTEQYSPQIMEQKALLMWRYSNGATHVVLLMWRYSNCATQMALFMWRYSNGATHVALLMWHYSNGAIHIEGLVE